MPLPGKNRYAEDRTRVGGFVGKDAETLPLAHHGSVISNTEPDGLSFRIGQPTFRTTKGTVFRKDEAAE